MKPSTVVFTILMLGALGLACSKCGLSTGQQVATVQGAADLIACILEHDQEPIERIAILCGAASIGDVQKILDAHRKAEIREGFIKVAPDGGK